MSESRKNRILRLFPFALLLLGMILSSAVYSYTYRRIAFEHISAFCETVLEIAPEAEPQLSAALKAYHVLDGKERSEAGFLKEYGYRPDEFCKSLPLRGFLIPGVLFLAAALAFAFALRAFRRQKRKRILDLTEYLERVNTGSGGTLVRLREDDFSHLQDEIYKTVTTLSRTRETAVAARKSFADNLANIAHQLKTPITAAFLSLQLMKEEAADHTNQIRKQLERLNRLEESLLMLSMIDAGTLPLKRASVDIFTVLNLAAENLSELMRKASIAVDIPENGCIEFPGDLEWTMEALINILKNCAEYSRPGGTVHCDYSQNPLYAEIRIWDEGAGFAPEELPRLFERFYRGRRAADGGIGIGLALARSIIELQNGTISAYNLPNGGACFEIRLYSH